MKLVLKVSSNNEHCDGGCELALVDLTPQLGAMALRRIAVLREQKNLDADVEETYYWAYVVEYFSPWVSLVSTEEEVEPAVKVANVLDELGIEELLFSEHGDPSQGQSSQFRAQVHEREFTSPIAMFIVA